jgi:hypothetical protein
MREPHSRLSMLKGVSKEMVFAADLLCIRTLPLVSYILCGNFGIAISVILFIGSPTPSLSGDKSPSEDGRPTCLCDIDPTCFLRRP